METKTSLDIAHEILDIVEDQRRANVLSRHPLKRDLATFQHFNRLLVVQAISRVVEPWMGLGAEEREELEDQIAELETEITKLEEGESS